MKTDAIERLILLALIVLAMPLSTWCIYGEQWRLFGERERQAYEASNREFRASTGPVVKAMIDDLNRALKAPPREPGIENRGRTWVLYLPGAGGAPRRVSYSLRGPDPAGICREEEGGGPPLFFPLALKSVEFRKTGEASWQCAFIREVRTAYGYMGDDWVLYTFGKAR